MSGDRGKLSRTASASEKDKLNDLIAKKRKAVWNFLRREWILSHSGGAELVEWIQEFKRGLAGFAAELRDLNRAGTLTTSIQDLGASIGHMHLNRAGLDSRKERELSYLLRKVYEGFLKHVPEGVVV
jgi:thiopeptide-type bacteriocin biosynthesis protein